MKRIYVLLLLVGLLTLVPQAWGESPSADEVIEKCVAALGGRDNWQRIESLELTGPFTSISEPSEFRLVKRRPNSYRYEYAEGKFPFTVGFDGKVAWFDRDLMIGAKGDWPVVATVSEAQIIQLDAEFEPPFLNYQERGHRLEFLGPADFDGIPSFAFDVLWATGVKERWHVDATTYRPVVRSAILPYIGLPQERRIYYSDYRQVEGIQIPHLIEMEFSNVDTVAEVENVRINHVDEPDLFRLAPPPGMARLEPLAGRFSVTVESLSPMFLLPLKTLSESVLELDVYDSVLREEATLELADAPYRLLRLFSYDRFRDLYRAVHTDNTTGHINVLEGNFDGDRLVLSNLDTGTAWTSYETTYHTRLILQDITPEGFQLEAEVSKDGGESWEFDHRLTYVRTSGSAPSP